MDALNKDHDIAPEFVAFLTEKLRTTKDSLKLVQEENEQLHKALMELQNRSYHESQNPKLEDDPEFGFTCRAGICPAKDEVKILSENIHMLETQLAAQVQEHTAEITRLQERLDRTKSKYTECKAKLKGCRKELEQLKDATPHAETDAQSVHTQDDAVRTTPIEASLRLHWQQQAGTVCVSSQLRSPFKLSLELRKLSNHRFLYLPANTILIPSGDFAWIYMPRQKCSSTMPLQWTANYDFDQHEGKSRDLFYKSDEGICYAGIYVHDYTSETTWQTYRTMERGFRDLLFRHTFTVHPSEVSEDVWETVYQMYWDGTSTMQCYQLRRIGFNQELYDAMITERGPLPAPLPAPDNASHSEDWKKRKAPENSRAAPVPKKPRN